MRMSKGRRTRMKKSGGIIKQPGEMEARFWKIEDYLKKFFFSSLTNLVQEIISGVHSFTFLKYQKLAFFRTTVIQNRKNRLTVAQVHESWNFSLSQCCKRASCYGDKHGWSWPCVTAERGPLKTENEGGKNWGSRERKGRDWPAGRGDTRHVLVSLSLILIQLPNAGN